VSQWLGRWGTGGGQKHYAYLAPNSWRQGWWRLSSDTFLLSKGKNSELGASLCFLSDTWSKLDTSPCRSAAKSSRRDDRNPVLWSFGAGDHGYLDLGPLDLRLLDQCNRAGWT